MRRGTDNSLFPDRATPYITQVVQFIKDDKADIGQRRREKSTVNTDALVPIFKKHIAIHLCCHNNNGGTTMLNNITSNETYSIVAVEYAHIAVFLVRKSFQWSGINDTLSALLRQPDRILSNERLSGSSWSSNHHRLTLSQMCHRL